MCVVDMQLKLPSIESASPPLPLVHVLQPSCRPYDQADGFPPYGEKGLVSSFGSF